MSTALDLSEASAPRIRKIDLSFRVAGEIESAPLQDIERIPLDRIEPIRRFAYFPKQTGNPGWYWSTTTRTHVPYESRLELAHLLLADFDPSVKSIVAQPLKFTWTAAGRKRRHTPDFLLIKADGERCLWNVATRDRAKRPDVAEHHRVCAIAAKRVSWKTAVRHEPDPIAITNLRLLSGARTHSWAVDEYADDLLLAAAQPTTIRELERRVGPPVLVRPAVLHLIWHHHLVAPIDEPLDGNTTVRRAEDVR